MDNIATISINTNPSIRGQGQGYLLIREFSNIAHKNLEVKEIIAIVKSINIKSMKSFTKAGFKKIEPLKGGKKIKYKLIFY